MEIALLHMNLVTGEEETFIVPLFFMYYKEIKDLKSVMHEMAHLHSIELRRIS